MKQITRIGLLALLALTGCETVQDWSESVQSWALRPGSTAAAPEGGCPSIGVVPELSAVYEYADPANTGADQLLYQAHITRTDIRCEKTGGNNVAVLSLNYAAELGPKGRVNPGDQPSFANPTFIAFIAPDGTIMAKENLALAASFPANDNRINVSESVRMPLPATGTARLLMGFQLEDWQLAQNRARITATGRAGTLDTPAPVTLMTTE